MDNKSENYIILKPIAEKFNNVAQAMTAKDIRSIIESEIRRQVSMIDFRSQIADIIQDYIDNNEPDITLMFKQAVCDKFKRL